MSAGPKISQQAVDGGGCEVGNEHLQDAAGGAVNDQQGGVVVRAAEQAKRSPAFKAYIAAHKAAVLKPATVKLKVLPNDHFPVMEMGEVFLANGGHG